MRKNHVLKKTGMTAFPENHIAVTGEFEWNPYIQFVSASIADRNGMNEFTNQAELWEFISKRSTSSNWVFMKDAQKVMTASGGISEMESLGWSLDYEFKEAVYITKMRKGMSVLKIVDISNYWVSSSFESIASHLGMSDQNPAQVVYAAMSEFMEFCQTNNLGSLGTTISKQTFNAFRHRFLNTKIYLHDKPHVMRLEGSAYFGGIVDCFQVGKMTGDLAIADFRSMYPSVMKNNKYPVRLIDYWNDTTFDSAASERVNEIGIELGNDHAIVARVSVNIPKGTDPRESACVPLHTKDGLIYPTGKFETVLTTRELQLAYERNYVTDVYEMAVYEQEHIFSEFVDFFWNLRKEAAGIEKEILKSFLNMLYGKFGQKNKVWREATESEVNEYDIDLLDDGEDVIYGDDSVITHVKNSGGSLLISDWTYATEAFWAIAAHITADGRVKLRNEISRAGWDNVFYCDTDSIHTNAAGLANLSLPDNPNLGELTIEQRFDTEIILALKTYSCFENGVMTRNRGSGMKSDAIVSGNSYTQNEYHKAGNTMVEKKVVKKIASTYSGGVIRNDGKIFPHHL